MEKATFLLKVSRPGLWFATVWLYMMPLSQLNLMDSWWFWLGLFYVCFPLNLLVYGWNDIADYEIDQLNPRKDSFLFGARGTKEQLERLPVYIVLFQCFYLPFIFGENGLWLIIIFAVFCGANYLYNKQDNGWRSTPPLDLVIQMAYVLVVPMSIWINDVSPVSFAAYVYLGLFAVQSHLIGEVMDLEADRKAGRRTTATIIGMRNTKLLIIGVVALECALLVFYFKDLIFGGMLIAALVWLLLDLFLIFKTNTYSVLQMKLFGILSNVIAVLSMMYVWYSGCLF